jgi:antitoxin (DNA-binding transcriptional repressor) of toxin-antitoxin stability system
VFRRYFGKCAPQESGFQVWVFTHDSIAQLAHVFVPAVHWKFASYLASHPNDFFCLFLRDFHGDSVTTVTWRDFRENMADVINQVRYARERVQITRHGKVVAELVPPASQPNGLSNPSAAEPSHRSAESSRKCEGSAAS